MRWQSFPCHLLAPLSIFKNQCKPQQTFQNAPFAQALPSPDFCPALLPTVQGAIRSINKISAAHLCSHCSCFLTFQTSVLCLSLIVLGQQSGKSGIFSVLLCQQAQLELIYSPTFDPRVQNFFFSFFLLFFFSFFLGLFCAPDRKILLWTWGTGGQWRRPGQSWGNLGISVIITIIPSNSGP